MLVQSRFFESRLGQNWEISWMLKHIAQSPTPGIIDNIIAANATLRYRLRNYGALGLANHRHTNQGILFLFSPKACIVVNAFQMMRTFAASPF
ncbi:MAG: hypothetical protein D6703_07065 [Zetaproteobacteria bacterium]|nr:MAG: hypothetical protein D6703_07065 [Zetaproteobacteria bacterium]